MSSNQLSVLEFIKRMSKLEKELKEYGPNDRLYLKAIELMQFKPGFVQMDIERYVNKFKPKE